MIVGLGGNNGSTFVGGLIANREKLSWHTKRGPVSANYYGSATQCSTLRLGFDENGEARWVGLNQILPMLDPNNLVRLMSTIIAIFIL